MDIYDRTILLLGNDAVEKLKCSSVIIFGLGGVGGFCAEALARCGVGSFMLVDSDIVAPSNLNRQIVALNSTVGNFKTEVMQQRILDINPSAYVRTKRMFVLKENIGEFDFADFDYVVDAVDTVAAKLAIISAAKAAGVPVISCMGAGNRVGGSFLATDIHSTSGCPLARVMRKELRAQGITGVKAVYNNTGKVLCSKSGEIGSLCYIAGSAGLRTAEEVVGDLIAAEPRFLT